VDSCFKGQSGGRAAESEEYNRQHQAHDRKYPRDSNGRRRKTAEAKKTGNEGQDKKIKA